MSTPFDINCCVENDVFCSFFYTQVTVFDIPATLEAKLLWRSVCLLGVMGNEGIQFVYLRCKKCYGKVHLIKRVVCNTALLFQGTVLVGIIRLQQFWFALILNSQCNITHSYLCYFGHICNLSPHKSHLKKRVSYNTNHT